MVSQQMKWWPGYGIGGEQERSLQDDMKLQSPYMTSAKVRVETWSTCVVELENSLL